MKYPYFRGLEADRYSFYRVPKALIKVDLFEKMSGDAKLLYAVLLDRMNLSLKNGWQDENGNAYIICTIDEIMDSIRCARQKAVKLLDELEHEYQLIERRRQGLGKPNLLYVKDLYAGLSQSNYWKYENQTSGGLKSELPGVWKSNGSKTDINNTDSSETDLIYFVYVKGFVGLYDCRTGGHIPFNVKSVFLVEVGKVFVVRVLRYIVLIAEKGAHAAQLQNTFSSVHNCDFVLCHQLLSQFLIIEAMRNLRAAIFGSVETVDCFTSQVLRNILCIFPAPSQKQGAVGIIKYDFCRVLVNGF